MLQMVFMGTSNSVSTWRAAVRAIERFEEWTIAHGLDITSVSGPRLATFLLDASNNKPTVLVALRSGLSLAARCLSLPWPVAHPVVTAVCKVSQRSAASKRGAIDESTKAVISVAQVQHLEFIGTQNGAPLGIRWAALLGCLLAHACSRFSDAQRAQQIKIGQHSLYCFCWKSKNQHQGFPFAALRSCFAQSDWARALVSM